MCCSIVFLIKFISIKGKTVVVDGLGVVVVVVNVDRYLSFEFIVGDGIVFRNDNAI